MSLLTTEMLKSLGLTLQTKLTATCPHGLTTELALSLVPCILLSALLRFLFIHSNPDQLGQVDFSHHLWK